MTSVVQQYSALQRCWNSTEEVFSRGPFSKNILENLKVSIQKIVKHVEVIKLGSGHCISFKIIEGSILYSGRLIWKVRKESPEEHRSSMQGKGFVYDGKRSFVYRDNGNMDWTRVESVTRYPEEVSLMHAIFGGNEISLGVVGYEVRTLERLTGTRKEDPLFQRVRDIFVYSRERAHGSEKFPKVEEIQTEERTIMYFPACKFRNNLGFFLTQIRKMSDEKIHGRGIIWDEKNQCIDESKLKTVQLNSYAGIFSGEKPQIFAQFPIYNEGYYEVSIIGYLVESKRSTVFSIESLFVYLWQRFSKTLFPRPSLWGKNISEKVENGKTTIKFNKVFNGKKRVSVKAYIEPFEGRQEPTRGLCWNPKEGCISGFEWQTKGVTLLRFYTEKYVVTVKSQ